MKEKVKGLYGLVLAGGRSLRMGRSKSSIEFQGVSQKEFAFQLLGQCCEKVYTSVGREAQLSDFKNPIIDKFSFGGPLNGILSAMEFQQNAAWLTLPVDMPLVNESLIHLLVKNRDKAKMATCFQHKQSGHLEPLLAIWEPHSRNPLLDFAQNEGRSPHDYLKNAEIRRVQIENSTVLKSVNTQEELEGFLRYNKNQPKK